MYIYMYIYIYVYIYILYAAYGKPLLYWCFPQTTAIFDVWYQYILYTSKGYIVIERVLLYTS